MAKKYIERGAVIKLAEKMRNNFAPLHRLVVDALVYNIETTIPDADVVEVKHGYWDEDKCSVCGNYALSSSWDEPIYDYDWEENLTYSYTETHTEYQLTDYCPFCGAKMDGRRKE